MTAPGLPPRLARGRAGALRRRAHRAPVRLPCVELRHGGLQPRDLAVVVLDEAHVLRLDRGQQRAVEGELVREAVPALAVGREQGGVVAPLRLVPRQLAVHLTEDVEDVHL